MEKKSWTMKYTLCTLKWNNETGSLRKLHSCLIAIFIATTFLITFTENKPALCTRKCQQVPLLYHCADNAVAPLNNLKDIQTFLSCNGFNPGPIDGLKQVQELTEQSKAFQKTVGLWQQMVK